MKARWLTGTLAAVIMGGTAPADESSARKSLFTPCADALTTPAFTPLRGVVPDSLESAGCLRLTDQEFLLLSEAHGPGQPFHYCDLRKAAPSCEAEPNWFYSFEVKQEFTGANGAQYMLWYTGQMKRGVHRDGYGIFSLVPKSIDPRGFDIYSLAGGVIFQSEDSPTSDPCRTPGEEAGEITGYELVGEGTGDVELRFTRIRIDCETRQPARDLLRFRPKNGRFEPLP